jgi:hypothetical protein
MFLRFCLNIENLREDGDDGEPREPEHKTAPEEEQELQASHGKSSNTPQKWKPRTTSAHQTSKYITFK